MKFSKKWILNVMILLISYGAFAQVSLDSIYHKRLFYLCKVWGHAKYYHTEIANGKINWDDKLLDVISAIKNAPDNNSFNDSLMVMLNIGEMGLNSDTLPDIPDSLNNNSDLKWISDPIFSTFKKMYQLIWRFI